MFLTASPIQTSMTTRCQGKTKKGDQCRNRIYGKYCYLHNPTKEIKPVQKEEKETCCICLETEVVKSQWLKCQHSVCKSCLDQMVQDKCPLCRRKLEGPLITNEFSQHLNEKIMDNTIREIERLGMVIVEVDGHFYVIRS